LADLTAHHVAYTKAEVEHRDISIGNIIIGEKNRVSYGLLIDWELVRFRQDPREHEGAVRVKVAASQAS
jgi:aminoglycoside phosphotransferase (APT) family kinase protein